MVFPTEVLSESKTELGCQETSFLPREKGQLWTQTNREREAEKRYKTDSALKASIELWIQPCLNRLWTSQIHKSINSLSHMSSWKLDKGRHTRIETMNSGLGAQQGVELPKRVGRGQVVDGK